MTSKPHFPRPIRIGILVYEGFEPIDVWGFTEAFAISRFIGTDYQNAPRIHSRCYSSQTKLDRQENLRPFLLRKKFERSAVTLHNLTKRHEPIIYRTVGRRSQPHPATS